MESIVQCRRVVLAALAVITLGWANLVFADDVPEMPATEMSVNINEADAETLANVLVGVGLSRAEAIVAYREAHGKFYSAEELTAVRGIGETTVARNEAKIRVE